MISNITYVDNEGTVFEVELGHPHFGVVTAQVEHSASGHQRCLAFGDLSEDDFDAEKFVNTVVAARIAGIRW